MSVTLATPMDYSLPRNALIITVSALLTFASYRLRIALKFIDHIDYLEAASVFTSYWCTGLCVFQKRFNYIIGAVSVALLCVLFYQQNLLSSMALQVYLFPVMAYGWLRWGRDDKTRPVTFVELRWWPAYILATGAVGALCMTANVYFGGSNAYWDTSVLVLSILAQFMLDNKKLENWLVWIAVDIISVVLYWNQGLNVLSIQMGLFTFNAVWGLYEWNKTRARLVPGALRAATLS